ncbi:PIN domain-like protein [Hortaea werneckii]|nr:PIN domain-like protein [Hortaea werneckii]
MGVTGLWQILQPCARPIKIETLNRKRLAVDASIWIYQFLKAVRDKEGNALRNSHVVGFFRRICKLLFFGIKPVFVFDGGAPALKRQTITGRKRRREGRREDAVRTAGKLLAVQMQRKAEQEDEERRQPSRPPAQEEEPVPDEGLVYVDELQMSQQERQQNRKFRKKDAYHLPEMDVSKNELGGENDPRVMSVEELQQYARQFEQGEDINVYDFSKIDFDSPFFMSLPASDRYNILNAARLRSRLRMGHTKEQLDDMFQDRMEFSKFQIARVAERNELTTRLMNINEGDAAYAAGGIGTGSNRVAGEKAREYVLVKNEGVEGGWALGVISDEGTKQETAIDLDKPAPSMKVEESDEDDDGFEDVPIEGLNRLPKRRKLNTGGDDGLGQQRQTASASRQAAPKSKPARKVRQDPESLFVGDEEVEEAGDDEGAEWEDVDANRELFGEADENEDEDLRQAIAMSLEKDHDQDKPQTENESVNQSDSEDDMLEVFQQRAVEEARPVPKGSARAIANLLNKRAHDIAPDSQEVTSFGVPVPKQTEQDSDEEDSMDLQAALAESRKGKRKVSPPQRRQPQPVRQSASASKAPEQTEAAKANGFNGPLPFEKLDLGTSLLGRKKMKDREQEAAGGFEHPAALEQQRKGEPLPPWFSGNVEEDMEKQRGIEREDRERAKEFNKQFMFQSRDGPALQRKETKEVIEVDTSDDENAASETRKRKGVQASQQGKEIIDLDADEAEAEELAGRAEGKHVDEQVRMGDVADVVRAEPPEPPLQDEKQGETPGHHDVQKVVRPKGPFEVESEDEEEAAAGPAAGLPSAEQEGREASAEDEEIDWSESDDEKSTAAKGNKLQQAASPVRSVQETAEPEQSPSPDFEDVPNQPVRPEQSPHSAKSPSPQFEDVAMEASRQTAAEMSPPPGLPVDDEDDASGPAPASGLANQDNVSEGEPGYFDDDFDDPEEEALLSALAQEAEEHARFASTLNNKTTTAQNILDYENELKQLRNQQKKDRRDADEVTHIMVQECQQLLRLFGLPYVTAPMEAEAQCAELVKLGLVDGIVTDDSDCFLFGGTRIYKNMFNQAKFVECYLTSDLEKEFNLTRVKLIAIAQLLGSDYTEGLQGVGPVTALEILGEFQNLEGFKEWWEGVQMQLIPKEADKDHPFRKKFRKNATKMFLPPSFPDPRVEKAYLEPEVDRDPEHFQWGVPDLDALRSFLMSTIGWSQERTDEVLVPVIKDMNRRADEGTQSNLTAFFEGGVGIGAAGSNAKGEAFAPRKRLEGSKRMGAALGRIAARAQVQRGESRAEDETPEHQSAEGQDGEGSGDANVSAAGSGTTGSKGRKARKNPQPEVPSDEDASEFEEPRKRTKRKAQGGKAARGRSRQKAALEE